MQAQCWSHRLLLQYTWNHQGPWPSPCELQRQKQEQWPAAPSCSHTEHPGKCSWLWSCRCMWSREWQFHVPGRRNRCREMGHIVKCVRVANTYVYSHTHHPTPSTFIRFSLLGTRMAARFPWTPSTMVYTRRIITSINTNNTTPTARCLSFRGCICIVYVYVCLIDWLIVALFQLSRHLGCHITAIHTHTNNSGYKMHKYGMK